VALIIKYKFHDEGDLCADAQTKKRKFTDTKRNNVIEYSTIKLPALMFAQYLEQDASGFIEDCIRYGSKKN